MNKATSTSLLLPQYEILPDLKIAERLCVRLLVEPYFVHSGADSSHYSPTGEICTTPDNLRANRLHALRILRDNDPEIADHIFSIYSQGLVFHLKIDYESASKLFILRINQ